MQTIQDVMTREVQSISPQETIQRAAQMMDELNVGSIPVLDGQKLVGMITDRDIAVRGIAEGHGPETPVRDLMSNDMVCAHIDDNVEDAATKMSEAQVRRLPVIDREDRLCGIVSLGDLAREAHNECAHQALEGVSQPGGQHQQ